MKAACPQKANSRAVTTRRALPVSSPHWSDYRVPGTAYPTCRNRSEFCKDLGLGKMRLESKQDQWQRNVCSLRPGVATSSLEFRHECGTYGTYWCSSLDRRVNTPAAFPESRQEWIVDALNLGNNDKLLLTVSVDDWILDRILHCRSRDETGGALQVACKLHANSLQ